MRDLVIAGAGGFAREVLQIAQDINDITPTWNVLGFLDNNQMNHGKEIHGFPVLGDIGWIKNKPETNVIVAIGGTAGKRRVVDQIREMNAGTFATLIHPRSWIGRDVQIGEGSIICAGVMATTDITVGCHVIVNLSCTIGHDAIVEDFVTILPSVNVSGNVRLGEGSDIGTGTQIIQGVKIGPWSVVGAGSVIVRDVPPNVTAVGVPAKVIKERPEGWHLA